jgi:16S rRNA (guanine966-N2)-methyltransferase
VATVRANLASTGLDGGTVVRADALRWLESAPQVDLALVDPPYEFEAWDEVLGRLHTNVLVAESDRAIELGSEWRVVRSRRYGGTVVTLAAHE